ncbi:MAG: T9SS type A sorting domain-containing protein, partial [Candidatus Zixiibacteriota bacterium]
RRPGPHHRAHKAAITTTLLALLIGPVWGQAHADCQPPIPGTAVFQPDATVLVEWVHPDWNPDTLREATGPYSMALQPGENFPNLSLAFKVTPAEGHRVIHKVRCYVIAQAGVSALEWESEAKLDWSIRPDLNGGPDSTVLKLMSWDLGSRPELRGGGYFEGSLDLWIPDDDTLGFWIVVEWPMSTEDVVALGVNNGHVQLPTMLGYGDPIVWSGLAEPAPLVEIITLPTQAPGGGGQAGTLTKALSTPDLFVVRSVTLQGFDSAAVHTAIQSASGTLRILDTNVFVGQEIAYSVGAVFEADTCWAGRSDTLTIPNQLGLSVAPSTLEGFHPPPNEQPLTLIVTNPLPGPVGLDLRDITDPDQRTDSGFGKLPDGSLSIYPAPSSVNGTDSAAFGITVDGSLPYGDLVGALSLTATEMGTGRLDRWGIPLLLHADQTTAVNDPDSDPVSGESPGWDVYCQPNPFSDKLIIRVSGDSIRRSDRGWGTAMGGSDVVGKVIVYDILGRVRAERTVGRSEVTALAAGSAVQIQIPETNTWPSGIYLCRVLIGGESKTVKLVRLR